MRVLSQRPGSNLRTRLWVCPLLGGLLVLGGCAFVPPPPPPPQPDVKRPPEPDRSDPTTAPQEEKEVSPATCAWAKTRGIATLLARQAREGGTAQGTWQFVPGDSIVFHPAPEGTETGDEFKALLRQPLSGPCDEPALLLFSPLRPEDHLDDLRE